MTTSYTLGAVGLFKWSLWYRFIFDILYLSRKLSISSRYPWCIEYRLLKYILMIFFLISSISFAIASVSFLFFLIWTPSLFPPVSLVKGLSMLLILPKKSFRVFCLFVCFFCFFVCLFVFDSLYISSFLCGWSKPWLWWFPAFYSSWVY